MILNCKKWQFPMISIKYLQLMVSGSNTSLEVCHFGFQLGWFFALGYQCQRHEQYSGQWRATEVRNCAVDTFVAFAMSKDR